MDSVRSRVKRVQDQLDHQISSVRENLETKSKEALSVLSSARIASSDRLSAMSGPIVVAFQQLPAWQQALSNPFLRKGFRAHHSFVNCLQSLFYPHNEWFNVWSHLAGFLIFCYLTVNSLNTWLAAADGPDKLVFLVFQFSATFLLGCSTAFHLFNCISKNWYKCCARADYGGISLLIVGSYFSPIYYSFYCQPRWAVLYLCVVSLLGMACVILSWSETFSHVRFYKFRAGVFLALGAFAVVPLPHALLASPVAAAEFFPLFGRMAIMASCYVGGLGFYVSHFPECCVPGKLDNTITSHGWWHLAVLGGVLSHYQVVQYAFLELKPVMENACPS